jgi:hypothetical protein
MFGLLAIPAGLYAATRIAAFAADENNRRPTGLVALPLTAPGWPAPRFWSPPSTRSPCSWWRASHSPQAPHSAPVRRSPVR